MWRTRTRWMTVAGWLLCLIATVLFIGQLGFLLLHDRFRVEYIDDRLYYLFAILFALSLCAALFLLFRFKWKGTLLVGGFAIIFLVPHVWLLVTDEKAGNTITSISPDFRQVFSIKGNPSLAEATYFRSYLRILGRPKEALQDMSADAHHVAWLTNDIAVLTYQARNGSIQQFIGTYGDRGSGVSYYNVGPEMHGVWEGEDVEVISSPDGMEVTVNQKTENFAWDELEQFGTIAIVLKKDGAAAWTIALDEDFHVDPNGTKEKTDQIILYEAALEKAKPYTLTYQGPYP